MIYRVEKYHEGETPILINGPDTVTAADIGSGRYSTAYPWQIPANESGLVTYHAWAEIWCAYKESGDAALPQNYASTAVLGESTNVGFLERIWQFILSLVGAKRLTPEIYQQVYPTLTYKYKSIVPTDANSLQYGTFNPLTPTPAIAKDCTNVWITFQYPGE
ncbi:hypothetical protein A2Y99_03525 [Candidatus Gottesmanbacteria bacterium RBG_13_37_7]|uniref:Uncharacterized protein n=1 Tax=Candidatus Gottesmanbacteria bacterium RBG_13_37_7 TaxID=1798369 RepID=A0A1F5YJH3_9BACT|nr:MAG: hypothetical protein A2Y99_03525 [Candidatus Gottesmanbacteria bacterium RBG_13_37_7]